jgi:hypothetical protein
LKEGFQKEKLCRKDNKCGSKVYKGDRLEVRQTREEQQLTEKKKKRNWQRGKNSS